MERIQPVIWSTVSGQFSILECPSCSFSSKRRTQSAFAQVWVDLEAQVDEFPLRMASLS